MKNYSALILILFLIASADGQQWTGFRGTDGSGVVDSLGSLSGSNLALKIRWKKKLGSGYSSVVVAGNSVVTMFCDQEQDYVVCLDAKTGSQNWQTPVGDKFKGENGSFDGPISTPLVFGERVYALDPSGKLVCLQLSNGETIWSKHLVDDFKSTRPMYGYATSPIVVGDTLILQTGVANSSLAGLSLQDGEIKWATTNDAINSQTPVSVELDGDAIVLAAGGKLLSGVKVETGEKLFEYEHKGGNGSAMVPVVLPDNKVLLTLDDAFSKLVSINDIDGDTVNVSELWQERSIKNTYNVPVLCNDQLFAYSTRILTCVDPATGRPKWKSRKPGDGFLIAADDKLIINTKKGSLHLAYAKDEGYSEIAQMKLFDDLVWSLPAFSNGAIYCRSLGEIACVDVISDESERIVKSELNFDLPLGPGFKEMLSNVGSAATAEKRQDAVDAYLSGKGEFPIIENDIVHFVYQNADKDVAVAGDIFGARQEKQMQRVSDTNLLFYSMQLPGDQRANYIFLVDYSPQKDPRNQRSTTSSVYAGEMEFAVRLRGEKPLEMSWFSMNDWSEPKYLKDLKGEIEGSLVEHKIDESSEMVNAEIYLPKGYEDSNERFRTIYMFTDPGHKTIGKLVPAIERIMSEDDSIEPAILVFPRFIPFARNQVSFAEDLVPSIDEHFRTIKDRKSRSCAGFGMMASGAVSPVAEHPELIGSVALYSPMIFDAGMRQIESGLKEIDQEVSVYVEWGRYDMFNPHENWDVRTIANQIYDMCKERDNVKVRGGMVNDSADWSSWRNRYIELLKH